MKRHLFAMAALALVSSTASSAAAIELTSARLSLSVLDDDQEAPDFETLTHLDLRLATGRSESGWSAEAALSLGVGVNDGLVLSDRSSFVRIDWRPSTWDEGEAMTLTLLPLTSARLHMGYEYAATWARTAQGEVGTHAPALDLRLQRERWYGFVALRIPSGLNDKTHERERLATWFGGGGIDVLPILRFEAAGMYSDAGAMPVVSVLGERSTAVGLSGRLLLHFGDPIGPGVDLALYRNDPELYERLFAPEKYSDRISLSVSFEASNRTQTLADPAVLSGLVDESEQILALQARVKTGPLRVHALGMYRSAMFPFADLHAGFPPYLALPADNATEGGVLVSGGADYHFDALGLTPGLAVMVDWPATFESTGTLQGNTPSGYQAPVIVVSPSGATSALPIGQARQPVLTAKATLRWDPADAATLLAEASWTRDDNRVLYVDSPEGVATPVPDPARILGLAAILQARF